MATQIPDYQNLDLSGEALQAAQRMEARASAPASQAMFESLVAPLLTPQPNAVLEFGCGTAALSRRIAGAAPQAMVFACDKSRGMLSTARRLGDAEKLTNLRLDAWDINDESTFPYPSTRFDLIISSVVIPYLDPNQVTALIPRLVSHLSQGGILAFIEQDWLTDTLNFPDPILREKILRKEKRTIQPTQSLGLRPLLRDAGLQLLPRQSFLWIDDQYNDYTRELLNRFADSAHENGYIHSEETTQWKKTLSGLQESGDFFYAMVYHLIAGKRLNP